ncbi:MAG: tetratricopeptide repeat protein [Magnetococcales bacterium]|nr:tetratricopeptide repeat protein [Magnetococcales bacterium]
MNLLRLAVRAVALFGLLGGAFLTSVPAFAGESLDEIYAIADRKEFDTALKRLNLFLTEHPQDAQGRFLKGLILTETRQRDQAIAVFQQLSKDFPELPEPYNNLAVLFAEQGQFDKAQEALNQAVKAHPNYATAHENLGDIHAKMASQAYSRALKLNQGNIVLANKLNKVKTLFNEGNMEGQASRPAQASGTTAGKPATPPTKTMAKSELPRTGAPPAASDNISAKKPAAPSAQATPAAQPEAQPAKSSPPQVEPQPASQSEAQGVKPASQPAQAETQPVKPASLPDSQPAQIKPETEPAKAREPATPAQTAAAEPAKPDARAQTPVAEPSRDAADKKGDAAAANDVKQAVLDWAAAWSAKSLDQYVGSYSVRFQPLSKTLKNRDAWEKNRREVIGKAGSIHIHVSDLRITMLNENRAQATFQQNYTANNYRDRVKKTLSLERESQGWKIVREYANE